MLLFIYLVDNSENGLKMKKQRGILTLDMGIGLIGLLLLTTYMLLKSEPVTEQVSEQILVDDILVIASGARDYRQTVTDGYTSVDLTTLSTSGKFINDAYGDGTSANPFGGDYTASVGATAGELVITATDLPTNTCEVVAAKIEKYATASCAAGVLTVNTI